MLNDVLLSDDDIDSSESIDDSDEDPDYVVSGDSDGSIEDDSSSDSESDDAVGEQNEIVIIDNNIPRFVSGRMKKKTNRVLVIHGTPMHNLL